MASDARESQALGPDSKADRIDVIRRMAPVGGAKKAASTCNTAMDDKHERVAERKGKPDAVDVDTTIKLIAGLDKRRKVLATKAIVELKSPGDAATKAKDIRSARRAWLPLLIFDRDSEAANTGLGKIKRGAVWLSMRFVGYAHTFYLAGNAANAIGSYLDRSRRPACIRDAVRDGNDVPVREILSANGDDLDLGIVIKSWSPMDYMIRKLSAAFSVIFHKIKNLGGERAILDAFKKNCSTNSKRGGGLLRRRSISRVLRDSLGREFPLNIDGYQFDVFLEWAVLRFPVVHPACFDPRLCTDGADERSSWLFPPWSPAKHVRTGPIPPCALSRHRAAPPGIFNRGVNNCHDRGARRRLRHLRVHRPSVPRSDGRSENDLAFCYRRSKASLRRFIYL